jgi:hypothetical protein
MTVSLDDLVAEPWKRCAGCDHDMRHHPYPPGSALSPCSWRGCGCPWFLYPAPRPEGDAA